MWHIIKRRRLAQVAAAGRLAIMMAVFSLAPANPFRRTYCCYSMSPGIEIRRN
jgi:hypothetical protein